MGQNEATNLPISFPKKTTLMPYFQVSLLNPHSSGNDINCICFLPRISSSGLREESQGFHLRQGALPGSWGSLDPRGCRVGPSVEGGASRHAPAPLRRALSGDLYLLGPFLPLPLGTPTGKRQEALPF